MKENTPAINIRDIFFVFLIILFGAAYFSLSYNGVFFPPDEGTILYDFEKCAEGSVQHRDFYSVYGAAFYILGEWLFKLFGFRVVTTRLFVLFLKLVTAVLVYFVAIGLVRRKFALFSAMGFIVWWADPFVATPIYLYPAHLSQMLGLVSILFLLAYCTNGRKLFVLCAGLAAGFSSLFKPNVGAFNMMAVFFFLFAREMLMDLSGFPAESVDRKSRKAPSVAKIWILFELCVAAGVAVILSMIVGKFGLEIPLFIIFLFPVYLLVGYLTFLAFEVMHASTAGRLMWDNCRSTFFAYTLAGLGFLFCQFLQAAYFMYKGVFGDYLHMLNTATSYYSGYAIPFPGGIRIVVISAAVLLTVLIFSIVMRATNTAGRGWKSFVAVTALALALVLPVLFFMRIGRVMRLHFLMWGVPLIASIFASLYLVNKDLVKNIRGNDTFLSLSGMLISMYAVFNLLDAYPKVDLGHFFMIMPPILILLGFLAQRVFDSWREYMGSIVSGMISLTAGGAITALIAVGIFLPSLFMMVMFHVLIVPLSDGGIYLPDGTLRLVPRYSPGLPRTEGLQIHVLDDAYWPPLVMPEAKDFFAAAERVSEITRKDEKVFSTMASGRMLYFLADRDSIWDVANGYIFQIVTGVTTSDALIDFSDAELARAVEREMPGAIIMQSEHPETRRFIVNFPLTWSFIQGHYRLSEEIGPFQIFIPNT